MTEFAAGGIDHITALKVSGPACDHCITYITEELETLDGAEDVSVLLSKGERSTITVLSDIHLDDAALTETIDRAGDYTLDVVERDDRER